MILKSKKRRLLLFLVGVYFLKKIRNKNIGIKVAEGKIIKI